MEETLPNPYWHPNNISSKCGTARVFYGSERWSDPPCGWFTPGKFTRDRAEAERICEAMAKLMKQSERPASAAITGDRR